MLPTLPIRTKFVTGFPHYYMTIHFQPIPPRLTYLAPPARLTCLTPPSPPFPRQATEPTNPLQMTYRTGSCLTIQTNPVMTFPAEPRQMTCRILPTRTSLTYLATPYPLTYPTKPLRTARPTNTTLFSTTCLYMPPLSTHRSSSSLFILTYPTESLRAPLTFPIKPGQLDAPHRDQPTDTPSLTSPDQMTTPPYRTERQIDPYRVTPFRRTFTCHLCPD